LNFETTGRISAKWTENGRRNEKSENWENKEKKKMCCDRDRVRERRKTKFVRVSE